MPTDPTFPLTTFSFPCSCCQPKSSSSSSSNAQSSSSSSSSKSSGSSSSISSSSSFSPLSCTCGSKSTYTFTLSGISATATSHANCSALNGTWTMNIAGPAGGYCSWDCPIPGYWTSTPSNPSFFLTMYTFGAGLIAWQLQISYPIGDPYYPHEPCDIYDGTSTSCNGPITLSKATEGCVSPQGGCVCPCQTTASYPDNTWPSTITLN